jgi:leucyl-tRNA synthetase
VKKIIVVLRDPESHEVNLRCDAFGSMLWRLRISEGEHAELISEPSNPASSLMRIARGATLLGDDGAVHYVPTRAARERIMSGNELDWPLSLVSRQQKLMRQSPGAIFRLPLDAGGQADQEEAEPPVEAFVTDWTSLPGACALAVHPAHPLSTGVAPGTRASFTGRFCRHPLTGDLLPIWVADWVKAEFGTGAVLINPGHNKADLEFSRLAGLPIQFALVPESYDGSPASWIHPPFIRWGTAIRSAVADGLSYDQAKNVYFNTVAGHGLAERYTDVGMGKFVVARPDPDGCAEVRWDHGRRTIALGRQQGEPVRLSPSPVLSVVEEHVRAGDVTIVAPSTRVETDLLAVRLLLSEPRIGCTDGSSTVVLVGNSSSANKQDKRALSLAMLVNAEALDTVTVKPQQLEICARFLRVHEDLAHADAVPRTDSQAVPSRTWSRIKELLLSGDLKQAFTHLYRVQKNLAQHEKLTEPDLMPYLALAHVLAGDSGRHSQEAMAAAWQEI